MSYLPTNQNSSDIRVRSADRKLSTPVLQVHLRLVLALAFTRYVSIAWYYYHTWPQAAFRSAAEKEPWMYNLNLWLIKLAD
jgi:hypothetical protein